MAKIEKHKYSYLIKCQTLSGKLSWSYYTELLSTSEGFFRSLIYMKNSRQCLEFLGVFHV